MIQSLKFQKQFTIYFLIITIISFIVIAVRNALVPFNHDETATFFMYIQSGCYIPYYAPLDANNHVLNSFLCNICFHLFGSSPFSLRLPNLAGFVVLVFATFKMSKHLQQIGSKIFITTALLFSFHWLSFFSACRGYGLSMALLAFAVAAMIDYINAPSKKSLTLIILFFQLAVSANLILIVVVLLLGGIIMWFQLVNKKLFNVYVILLWLLNFGVIYYWFKFSLYLKSQGLLYYGEGLSYWKITFLTLIELIVGVDNFWVKLMVVLLFAITIAFVFILNKKEIFNLKKPNTSVWLAFVLCTLILGFYLMKVLMNINYPEDRTGLFFYLFFILTIAFTFDKLKVVVNTGVFGVLSFVICIHYFVNINFRKHSLNEYETLPYHFYDTLVKEQQKSNERITIGGHRLRELFYGFINYRNKGYLNGADPVEYMQMDADYYIAHKVEEKYFKPYYDIIDTEPDWGFLIVKRKQKIKRVLLDEIKNQIAENEDDNDREFSNLYSKDYIDQDTRPVLAEVTFDVEEIKTPNNIWFVLQVNDSAGKLQCYKRYPLYWSGDDLTGRNNLCYGLLSDNLPKGKKSIVCYFWNIKKEPFFIKVKSVKLYRLEGEGIQVIASETK